MVGSGLIGAGREAGAATRLRGAMLVGRPRRLRLRLRGTGGGRRERAPGVHVARLGASTPATSPRLWGGRGGRRGVPRCGRGPDPE